jgi:hypothetical protein
MANVVIACNANPAAESITKYHFFQDGSEVGNNTSPDFTIPNVVPGAHSYTVAAENIWGLGPQSDPVVTPAVASKCGGVNINVVININV